MQSVVRSNMYDVCADASGLLGMAECLLFLLSVGLYFLNYAEHLCTIIHVNKDPAMYNISIKDESMAQTEIVLKTLNPVYAVLITHPGICGCQWISFTSF